MDIQLFNIIAKEKDRQNNQLSLIASENYVSAEVQAAMSSCLTNKYAEGYPDNRYYGGCQYVDEVEDLCRERAKTLFGAEYANVQPHSGTQANMAAYAALLRPGDKILASSLNSGGHLTHGSPLSFVSHMYEIVTYDVDPVIGIYNYDEIRRIALRERPKLIVAGASAYPRTIDFERFYKIANEVGAYLMVDMAHIAGLVAAGLHPSPIPYADVVTTTTHKTLRGPRGGMILCKKKYAQAIDKAVFPYSQGGPLMHTIAAKAVCLHEAMTESFTKYQSNVIKNAQFMAEVFRDRGLEMVSGGTDNHLLLLNLTNTDWTGADLEDALAEVNVIVNKNMIPNDTRKPSITSGIRIGTPAMTTRGVWHNETLGLALGITELIWGDWKYFSGPKDLAASVLELCEAHPVPGGFI